MRYRTVIIYLSIIGLFFALCFGGIAAYMYNHKPIQYPGTGLYDLSTYFPCSVKGEIDKTSIEILTFDFLTNSTEIKVVNKADSNVTVYLYDTLDKKNRAIGSFSLEAGECKKFTNLTSARNYRIGVESVEQEYAITISD